MEHRPRVEALFRVLGIIGMLLCSGGAVFGMIVVLFRLPALANTKLEMLFGVLQGVAVSLLFAIAALLINLTIMVRRATHQPASIPGSERARS